MAQYTRYKAGEDVPAGDADRARRNRRRRRKRGGAWRWARWVVLALVLLFIIGLAAGAGVIYALTRNLPSLDELQRRQNPVNTVIYDRDGEVIAELHGAENRVKVRSEQISDVMKQATVAVEDERFYDHHGVDLIGITRAMLENLKAGAVVQGGSTITAQFVKNAYVGGERSYARKLREAYLAWQLEDRWPKDRILTAYLNTVYFGAGAYGVEAASRTYFHKSAEQLTLKEAALLAALIRLPSKYAPTTDPKQARERRDLVLDMMAREGYVTQARADQVKQKKLGVFKNPPNNNNSEAAYFVDYVTRQLIKKYGAATDLQRRSARPHQHRHGLAERGARVDPEHHRQSRLRRLEPLRRARRRRPRDGLHPHDGRRHRLQETEVQPRLAVAPSGRVRDEDVRADVGGRDGHEPGVDLLRLAQPDDHPDARRRAVDRQHVRPQLGRPHHRLGGHGALRQQRLRTTLHGHRARERGRDVAEDGHRQPPGRRAVDHPRHRGCQPARDGGRVRDPGERGHLPRARRPS